MPGVFQVILINRIVHHSEPVQFMVANLHCYFKMGSSERWFQFTMPVLLLLRGCFRSHFGRCLLIQIFNSTSGDPHLVLHCLKFFLSLANQFFRIDSTVQFVSTVREIAISSSGRNQPSKDDIFFESPERVILSNLSRIGQNFGGFLKGGSRDKRIRTQRSFGDSQQFRF